MGPILSLIVPALVPALADGLKGLFGRVFGSAGAIPQNFDQALAWEKIQIEKLQALAALDAPSANISRWVADLRASSRYILAGVIIISTFLSLLAPGISDELKQILLEMSGSVFAFLFGDRMYRGIRKYN